MDNATGGRKLALVFLAVSLVAAVVAATVIGYVFQQLNQDVLESQIAPVPMVSVIQAATDIHQGHLIKEDDLVIREIPEKYVASTAIKQKEEVINRVPTERILQGEFIRTERLAAQRSCRMLNCLLPEGQRAYQINLSGGSAVAGFINPGNYVDIILVGPDANDVIKSTTMLQAVQVLAVNDLLNSNASSDTKRVKSPSVTLKVTPKQANMLTLAVQTGEVTLTLRTDIDVMKHETRAEADEGTYLGTKDDHQSVDEWKQQTSQTGDGSTIQIINGTSN